MKKLSLIPFVLIVTLGAVWASTIIFPNTTEFPRTPQIAGTIWGVLYDWFNTDGTARNTDKLGGISASGYLQNHDCSGEPINKVWVGIDADGRSICGSKTIQLASIGKFSEIVGNIQVKKNGSAVWTPANTTDPLTEWDIIQTDSSSTGTIAFIADESILRLDTSTTVELSIGDLSGQSVAQAILTDGRLWGRILTSTGVNLGGWGTVAWVRGTSVSVTKTSTGYYTITIIDSTNPTSAASVVGGWGTTYTLSPGEQVQYPLSTESNVAGWGGTWVQPTLVESTIGKSTLLAMSAWIRDNTRKDIDYLYANSGAGLNTRVVAEYNTTVPLASDTINLTALCSDANHVYWPSLIPTLGDKCRESSLYAFANYSSISINGSMGPARPLIFRNNIVPASGNVYSITDGYMINNPGQYISYALDNYTVLTGKTIIMRLSSEIPDTWKHYILDFGGPLKVLKDAWVYKCMWRISLLCELWDINEQDDHTILTITLPATPTPSQMVMGNTSSLVGGYPYQFPIWTTIKRINIQ